MKIQLLVSDMTSVESSSCIVSINRPVACYAFARPSFYTMHVVKTLGFIFLTYNNWHSGEGERGLITAIKVVFFFLQMLTFFSVEQMAKLMAHNGALHKSEIKPRRKKQIFLHSLANGKKEKFFYGNSTTHVRHSNNKQEKKFRVPFFRPPSFKSPVFLSFTFLQKFSHDSVHRVACKNRNRTRV